MTKNALTQNNTKRLQLWQKSLIPPLTTNSSLPANLSLSTSGQNCAVRSLTPIIEELAEEYEGKVVIGKCDVDQNNDLAMKFSVRNIPLVVFVKPGGQMNDKLVGAASKDAIKAKIDALL